MSCYLVLVTAWEAAEVMELVAEVMMLPTESVKEAKESAAELTALDAEEVVSETVFATELAASERTLVMSLNPKQVVLMTRTVSRRKMILVIGFD